VLHGNTKTTLRSGSAIVGVTAVGQGTGGGGTRPPYEEDGNGEVTPT
jgi:hypothetical protein